MLDRHDHVAEGASQPDLLLVKSHRPGQVVVDDVDGPRSAAVADFDPPADWPGRARDPGPDGELHP